MVFKSQYYGVLLKPHRDGVSSLACNEYSAPALFYHWRQANEFRKGPLAYGIRGKVVKVQFEGKV